MGAVVGDMLGAYVGDGVGEAVGTGVGGTGVGAALHADAPGFGAYVPIGHGTQECMPGWLLNRPCVQLVHVSQPCCPDAQMMHATHVCVEASRYVPAAHVLHCSAPLFECVLAAHASQDEAAVDGWYLPAGHAVHAGACGSEYSPPGQLLHVVAYKSVTVLN